MDTRTQDSASSKPDKKRHIQRMSPSHYHSVYRPRFERKNIRSRFRFFRTMEERFFQRPHAWWNQRPRAAQWWSLQLKPRAASLSRLESSSIKHVKHTTADIPVPSSGERPPLSFKVLQKANKRDSGSSAIRKRAIQKKQEQIEEVYRQDCDTFGMVVKMLVSKDPSLEKPIQLSLRENLRDIGARCIQAMEQFIQEYDSRERGAPSASRKPSIS